MSPAKKDKTATEESDDGLSKAATLSWLNKLFIHKLSNKCSRNNTPSRAHLITKWVRQHTIGNNQLIVVSDTLLLRNFAKILEASYTNIRFRLDCMLEQEQTGKRLCHCSRLSPLFRQDRRKGQRTHRLRDIPVHGRAIESWQTERR